MILTNVEKFINHTLYTHDETLWLKYTNMRNFMDTHVAEYDYINNYYKKYNSFPDISDFRLTFPNFPVDNDFTFNEDFVIEQIENDKIITDLNINYNTMRQYAMEDLDKAREFYLKMKETPVERLVQEDDKYSTLANVRECIYDCKLYDKMHLPHLDFVVPLTDESLITFMAKPGNCKTWICCKTIANIMTDKFSKIKNIGYIQGEQTLRSVWSIILGCITEQNSLHLKANDSDFDTAIEMANKVVDKNKTLYVDIADTHESCSINIESIEKFIKQKNLDILFIDYFGLIDAPAVSGVTWEKWSALIRAIKQLQVKYRIPIVLMAQKNRVKSDEPDLEQVACTTDIGRFSTSVIDLDYNKVDKELTLTVVKNRDGDVAVDYKYKIDWDTNRITTELTDNEIF